ncbi:MAG: glycosyltransferase family 39 protein [Eubacteriales bacterium]|nr:glycosyltransferase family 39 protein [Eubacteriales bacterium]
MRRILFLLIIVTLISIWAAGTVLADDVFKPSDATASSTALATAITVVVAALFIVVCVFLAMRQSSSGIDDDGKIWPAFLLSAALAVILRVIVALAFEGYSTDIACFKGWAIAVYEYGPQNFYTSGVFADYPPGYMYVLYVLGLIREVFSIEAGSALFTLIVKLPSIIAEVVASILIYKIAAKQIGRMFGLLCAAFLLFNPALFFNSSAWGQIDAVFTLFIVLALYYLKKENYILGAFFYAVTLLIKPQAIMFAPVVGLCYFYALFKKHGLKKALFGITGGALVAAAVLFAGIFPFTGTQEPAWILKLYQGAVNFYPYASLNAFNLYALIGANWADSFTPFLLLNYQTWGMIMILLICVVIVFLQWRTREQRPLFDLSGFLILSVFMLAHAMHERYILPACVCLIFAYVYSRDSTTLFFAAAFSISALFNQMVTLYADSVVTAPLPTLIFSAINMALYAVYAVITIRKLASGKVLIKSPALL